MSFRRRLLIVFPLLVLALVAAVDWMAALRVRVTFNTLRHSQASAIATGFRRQLGRRETDVDGILNRMAEDPVLQRIARGTGSISPAQFLTVAASLAGQYHLDDLEVVSPAGRVLSSARWPARYGHREPQIAESGQPAFLAQQALPDGSLQTGIFAVRPVGVSGPLLYLVGERQLTPGMLQSVPVPADFELSLYSNNSPTFDPRNFASADDRPAHAVEYASILDRALSSGRTVTGVVALGGHRIPGMDVTAVPLQGPHGQVVSVLVISASRLPLLQLLESIGSIAAGAAGAGILLALLAGLWIARSVARPLRQLTDAAQQVAEGNWNARVTLPGRGGFGPLARSFNRMTRELSAQNNRLLQTERVAAWQDFARHLAREIDQPLLPLQRALENMMAARHLPRLQFDVVFDENAANLHTELRKLRAMVARFGDFSRAPQPRLETTDLRGLLHGVISSLASSLDERDMELGTSIAAEPLPILGDPGMLFSALYSLILIAADEAPPKSLITISAANVEERAHVSIVCRDSELDRESGAQRYNSFAASRQQETDLGLASIRAVLTGHRASLTVDRPEDSADFHFRYGISIPLANMLLSAPRTGA